jgi:hypothetical protein
MQLGSLLIIKANHEHTKQIATFHLDDTVCYAHNKIPNGGIEIFQFK